MNLLQVQDALKNASDMQLQQEMTAPKGMAPQFLILSEMKRRQAMRGSQPAPQGTVADELTEQMASGGLVALRGFATGGYMSATPYADPGAQNGYYMDPAQIQRTLYMDRAPGVTAPAAKVVSTVDPAAATPTVAEQVSDVLNTTHFGGESGGAGAEMAGGGYGGGGGNMGGDPQGFGGMDGQGGISGDAGPAGMGQGAGAGQGIEAGVEAQNGWASGGLVGLRRFAGGRDIRSLGDGELRYYADPNSAMEEINLEPRRNGAIAPLRGVMMNNQYPGPWSKQEARLELARRMGGNNSPGLPDAIEYQRQAQGFSPPAAQGSAVARAPGAQADPPYADDLATHPDIPRQPAGANAPPAVRGGLGGGGGAPGAGIAGLARSPAGLPTPPQEPKGQQEDPSSRWSEMRKELAASREDPAQARREAGNMALIEAGLRIAGSQSPHLAAAVGEAAPSVQTYTKQMNDLKKGGREDLATRIALENGVTTDQYRRDMTTNQRENIAAHERMNERSTAATLAAAGMTAGAHLEAARMTNNRTPAEIQQLEFLEKLRTSNPDAYQAALQRLGRDQMTIRSQTLDKMSDGISTLEAKRGLELKEANNAINPGTAAADVNRRYDALVQELKLRYRHNFPDYFPAAPAGQVEPSDPLKLGVR